MTRSVYDAPVLVVAGARPNFMKVVPILHALERAGLRHVFVHTGQHYDITMSEALLADLRAPRPAVMLEVGSASHAVQTARVMERFEPVLLEHQPSWVVVVGDVNSTLACALVAAKLRGTHGCRIAHVESGLRSFDWDMPEEVNRVLTDHLSDLLLTPIEEAAANIAREGLSPAKTVFVGNVMIDALLEVLPRARAAREPERFGVDTGSYLLATLHRPSNVDDPAQLRLLLTALAEVGKRYPVVLPLHPRTRARIEGSELEAIAQGLILSEPLGYAAMVGMLDGAAATITDSGGVQQEASVLGVPCLTMRAQTEWPSTLSQGTNRLASWPPTPHSLAEDIERAVATGRSPVGARAPNGWDGHAADRIVDALMAAESPPVD